MTTFFNSQSDIDVLTNAWEHHLSCLASKVKFINQQRPLYYSLRELRADWWVTAESHVPVFGFDDLGCSILDVDAMCCFMLGV